MDLADGGCGDTATRDVDAACVDFAEIVVVGLEEATFNRANEAADREGPGGCVGVDGAAADWSVGGGVEDVAAPSLASLFSRIFGKWQQPENTVSVRRTYLVDGLCWRCECGLTLSASSDGSLPDMMAAVLNVCCEFRPACSRCALDVTAHHLRAHDTVRSQSMHISRATVRKRSRWRTPVIDRGSEVTGVAHPLGRDKGVT